MATSNLPELSRVWNAGERHVPAQDPESANHYRHMTAYHFAVSFVRGRDVLDYGCGSGYGANFLRRRGAPRSIVGLDVSADAILYCRSVYEGGDQFRVLESGAVPLEDSSVDVALLFQTIEHVPDDAELLRELARALRPRGKLLITTPNAALYGGDLHDPENEHHLREYDRRALSELCRSVFPIVNQLGVRGSFRVGGRGLGLERSLAFRAVRKAAALAGMMPYVPPVSLADFAVGSARLHEALDLLFICAKADPGTATRP